MQKKYLRYVSLADFTDTTFYSQVNYQKTVNRFTLKM